MNVDWNGYEVYHPGVTGPLTTLPRGEARQAFDRLMAAKASRIQMLGNLLKANGVQLGATDAAVQDLNDWFRANVEEDPQQPGRLSPNWYSVVNDIALFLGDLAIQRHPHLRWEFFTQGKSNVSYQRHVIMGFTQVANPKISQDVDRLVAAHAHRIISGKEPREDVFLSILTTIDSWA